jgi:CheY-like chemotaxis protein
VIKPRILIVDDEPALTRAFRHHLEETGRYEVREENDPTQALATVMEFRPDLVLIDQVMPKVDGSDVAAWLRAQAGFRNLRIILVSGMLPKEGVVPRAKLLGNYPFLPKPVDAQELIDAIDRELTRPAA